MLNHSLLLTIFIYNLDLTPQLYILLCIKNICEIKTFNIDKQIIKVNTTLTDSLTHLRKYSFTVKENSIAFYVGIDLLSNWENNFEEKKRKTVR